MLSSLLHLSCFKVLSLSRFSCVKFFKVFFIVSMDYFVWPIFFYVFFLILNADVSYSMPCYIAKMPFIFSAGISQFQTRYSRYPLSDSLYIFILHLTCLTIEIIIILTCRDRDDERNCSEPAACSQQRCSCSTFGRRKNKIVMSRT